jgi:sugar phosphate isomerase/epimerase
MYFQRWLDQSDLTPFFRAGYDMGFDAFELGHVVTPEALSSVRASEQNIVAVHHPCPNDGSGRQPALTALSKDTRLAAMAGIRRSMQTAVKYGAAAIVLHLGSIEDDRAGRLRRLKFELESRFRAGQKGTEQYETILEQSKSLIAQAEVRHLEAAMEPLREIAAEAADLGLTIGLETGYHLHELPRAEGMQQVLDALPSGTVGAWLDTGHVGVQVNLGLVDDFSTWFDAVGDRWCGAHLNDVVGLRDHLVPGAGALNFASILDCMEALCMEALSAATLEVDWYFTPEEVGRSLDHLRRLRPSAD